MIQLDQNNEWFQKEFGRFKNPPTHVYLVSMTWAIPFDSMDHRDPGYTVMLRPRFDGVYVFGRLDDQKRFYQDSDDARHMPIHAGADMYQYDVTPEFDNQGRLSEPPSRTTEKQRQIRNHAIRDALLAHKESPHPEDPTQRTPAEGKVQNRFSTDDADIVFSHIDPRLIGTAIPKAIAVSLK